MLAELPGLVPTAAFVALTGAAGVWDLRTRRIPNRLTIAMLVCGLAVRAWFGWASLGAGLAGGALGLALALVLFSLGAMGGGDGKLLIAIGAFMGFGGFAGALLLIGVLGGLLGVAEAVRRGVILPAVYNAFGMMRRWVTLGRAGAARSLESPGAVAVPYGVAIAVGAIAWWFWGVPVL